MHGYDSVSSEEDGGGGGEEACAFFGFSSINVPNAVNAAYLPNLLIACFLSSSFLLMVLID